MSSWLPPAAACVFLVQAVLVAALMIAGRHGRAREFARFAPTASCS